MLELRVYFKQDKADSEQLKTEETGPFNGTNICVNAEQKHNNHEHIKEQEQPDIIKKLRKIHILLKPSKDPLI